MGRCLCLLWVFACVLTGVEAACQEVVIFTDHRSLVVQSHRVDGSWTYLKVSSGEMAVPTASVLRFTLEKTTGPSRPISPALSPAPSPAPVSSPVEPAVSSPPPWRSEPAAMPRPPAPLPEPEPEEDDEEDVAAEMDEEETEKEPDVESPPSPPGQPGKMPPQPNVPRPFPQPQEPGESKE